MKEINTTRGKEDEYLMMLNSNYLERFSKNYLNKLQIYIDDQAFNKKATTLPQLKSITILKIEKMIKKENLMDEKKKLKELNKLGGDNRMSKVKYQKVKVASPLDKMNKIKRGIKNYSQVRYIILDAGNKTIDINNIEDDHAKTEIEDPYRIYLQEDNEKLRKKALEKIVANAMNLTNSMKTSSPSKRKNLDSMSISKSNRNSAFNLSDEDGHIDNDKQAIEMLDSHLSKKKNSHLNEWTKRENEREDNQNFMKFFNEACDLNNFITVEQKIEYFMHLKQSMLLMNPRTEKRNLLKVNTSQRRRKQLGSTGDIASTLHSAHTGLPDINGTNPNDSNQLLSFYENRPDERTNSLALAINGEHRHRPTHSKVPESISLQSKYISDLKNKFKSFEDISNKAQIDLDNFYPNFLTTKIKQSKISEQGTGENYVVPSSFDRIKTAINTKELSGEQVILRECDITVEKFQYMIGKKAFDFRLLQHINLSRNLLGDTGASYLLYLVKQYSTRLEYLDLSYNKIGKVSCDYIAEILCEDKLELLSLNLNGNKIGDKNFSEICVGISKNSSLEKLSIAFNELGHTSSVILGTILRYDKKIKFLDASKNYFNDEVIRNLLKGLIGNSALESLSLNENNLTNSSLKHFETTLSVNSTMKEIFLEKNLFGENSSSKFLSILYNNFTVKFISLIGNKLNHKFAEDLLENEKKMPLKVISKSDYFQMKMKDDDKINFHEIF